MDHVALWEFHRISIGGDHRCFRYYNINSSGIITPIVGHAEDHLADVGISGGMMQLMAWFENEGNRAFPPGLYPLDKDQLARAVRETRRI
jgi:hypothetical protein